MASTPLTAPTRQPEDIDAALRPKTLDEFVGQKAARENLRVFIQAAKARGDALDHVLFFGPPGLGDRKSTRLNSSHPSISRMPSSA